MKRLTFPILFLLTLSVLPPAPGQEAPQTWQGYLADQMCAFRWRGDLAETYAKRHTRSCNFDEECMASGYGIMVKGTFLNLAEASNPKAVAYLESIAKRNDIYVEVTGRMVDDVIEVEKIETAERAKDEE